MKRKITSNYFNSFTIEKKLENGSLDAFAREEPVDILRTNAINED